MQVSPAQHGCVYWITGMPGAGKSTVGAALVNQMRATGRSVIFLDGDVLRALFEDSSYTESARRKIARRNAGICQLLASQGIDVVCATVSLFHEVREWNRDNLEKYFEIFIRVTDHTLLQRNQKGLYTRTHLGDLLGKGVPIELPSQPDLILNNDGELSPQEQAAKILNSIGRPQSHAA